MGPKKVLNQGMKNSVLENSAMQLFYAVNINFWLRVITFPKSIKVRIA